MREKSLLKLLIFILACAFNAAAHPLGNFTVNQYSRLEVERSQIKIRAVLDMAEIPTFQESQAIDQNKDGLLAVEELNAYAERLTPDYIANLSVLVNGETLEIRPLEKNISLPMGSGNLPTLRIEWNLVGELKRTEKINRLRFENKNYADRIGWNEIVASRSNGIDIFDSTVFGSGASEELKAYPQDSLAAPLSERGAELLFADSGNLPANHVLLRDRDGRVAAPVQKDRLAELINVPEITLPVALFGLALAFGLGAMHALSPGHGKTVVGAYLVGSRGTVKHAAFLGLTVTITHTLGVFALGLVTLFASNYILPERLLPFLNFVSGLLVLFIGLTLFKDRLFSALGWNTDHHAHSHDVGSYTHRHENSEFENYQDEPSAHSFDSLAHTHDGIHYHSHLPPRDITWRSLLTLGISGGLLPCPSALVLMLAAISLARVGYGLILTVAFSLGLATTLVCVGLAFLYVGRIFENPSLAGSRLVKTLPVISALVIACLGAAICYSSVR